MARRISITTPPHTYEATHTHPYQVHPHDHSLSLLATSLGQNIYITPSENYPRNTRTQNFFTKYIPWLEPEHPTDDIHIITARDHRPIGIIVDIHPHHYNFGTLMGMLYKIMDQHLKDHHAFVINDTQLVILRDNAPRYQWKYYTSYRDNYMTLTYLNDIHPAQKKKK